MIQVRTRVMKLNAGSQLERLPKTGCPQDLLIHPAPGAAIRKLAVNNDGRHRADAEGLGALRYIDVVHVMDRNFTGRACDALHHLNDLCAGRAARTEHLDFSLCSHWFVSCIWMPK